MMRRLAQEDLSHWLHKKGRLPLILRGARQVGKSTLVRLFCEDNRLELIEINLEKGRIQSAEQERFELQELLDEIQIQSRKTLNDKSLIFFDEIQEQPALLERLRYFQEERPEIAVIAAGSLLEHALEGEKFSFPVGRVEFYHLGPMTFQEFLIATGNEKLVKELQSQLSALHASNAADTAALSVFRQYLYVGGMPKAVRTFVEEKSLANVRETQNQILQAYAADFPKYNARIQSERVQRVFQACAQNVGKKIIFQHLDPHSKSRDIRRIVELLIDARLLLPCVHSDGNTVPLGGESDLSIQKTYFIDVGLMIAMLKLGLDVIDEELKHAFNSKGVIAEQFVAQHLAFLDGNSSSPSLHYWLRDKGPQKGEVDFLIEHGPTIVPIEVKSTSSGHLKSAFYFAKEKKNPLLVKASVSKLHVEDSKHKIKEDYVPLRILNLPLYAIEWIQTALKALK